MLSKPLLPVIALLLAAAGPTQPQTTTGPCSVKEFFIVALGTSDADMTIAPGGQACTFTVISPNLQLIQSAAQITTPPAHGQAAASLVDGNRSAAISYAPAPGYHGPDRFTALIEPAAKTVIVKVDVR